MSVVPELLVGRSINVTDVVADEEALADVKANRAANCALGLPAVPAARLTTDGEAAIVGFGPSLAETWEALRAFPVVWTTSKAHDFLLDRGIVPTFHTDVDFHEHKHTFIREFRPDVQYWLATQVHPAYVRRVVEAGVPARLFHMQMIGGGPYEPGYPKFEARFDAALQAADLAYAMGYRKQHWFGVDASTRGAQSHAGPHNGFLRLATPHKVLVRDRVYDSNALLARAACFAEQQINARPKLRVTIHGDGLLRPFLQERGRVRVS